MSLGGLTFSKMLLLAVFFVAFLGGTQRAQAVSPSSILVDVSPENPSPGENINISLESYAVNLDSVIIAWKVGNNQLSSQVGQKSFSLIAPAAGTEVTVMVTIALPDGVITKNIIIRPITMALLWEATDSYTPPFYKGKALPSLGSEIKVVAVPELKIGTQVISPKNMVYAWQKDYSNDPSNSGYGKNYYAFINDYLDSTNNINVTASSVDEKFSSKTGVNIRAYNPKIVFYKHDPSFGTLWEKALADGHKILSDIVLEASPYFISPKDIRIPSLTWEWAINNNYVATPGIQKNVLPLKLQPGSSGTSRLQLNISNKYKIFENAEGQINITF